MNARATALVALGVIGAGAVIVSLVATRPDEAKDLRPDVAPAAREPAFTVIDDEELPPATPSPTPPPPPTAETAPVVRRAPVTAQPVLAGTPEPTRRRGRTRVTVTSGEHSETSTGEDDEEQTDD